ncbi:MAG TPA: DUF934 domain-containing protein [Sandaracinaceae bacterium LLY-WYZ-13_1]|nr:DUF934 domain-containing protein [Sandaracinaceae bacterium LLY-WYZ-13_1]
MTLIRRDEAGARVVPDDPWTALEDEAAAPAEGDVTVSLARFERELDDLRARPGRTGVRVPGDADPDAIGPLLAEAPLVTVDFPKFTDGRGYSVARVLRERHGFAGELRAVGHVLRDQLFYMARCGFDTFELTEGKDVDDALAAFEDFSLSYQPAADGTAPIWRRRAAEAG